MKYFIILCCFVVITIATPTTFELLSKWNQFKSTHGKNYENPIEEKKRIEIFANNVKKIEEHNKLYEQGLSKYKMAVNKFADWNHEEFVEYLTKQKRVKPEALFTFQQPLNVDLPKAVDWRKHGAVTPVKNQGDCGSCWAFSTTGSLEGQRAIKKGKLVSLSEQELVDCSTDNIGCHGGRIDTAFNYVKQHGLTTEQEYPYDGTDYRQCRRGNKTESVRTKGYVDIPTWNEPSLLSAVATVGPISAGVDSISWTFYSEGIFDSNCFRSVELLNHGVLVVGYGTDKNGEEYWIVKNSWGNGWGERGYIRLPRNHNTCGIATEASYPLLA